MFHYLLYQTTNLINGKIYIGIHKTKNINDGYIGSGKLLLIAIGKYGIENFRTEILLDCLSLKDLLKLEAEIVNEDFIERKDTYNLKVGGQGGWDYINKNGQCYNVHKKLKEDENFKIEFCEKVSKGLKKAIQEGNFNPKTMLGKKHTELSKRKIAEKNSKHQTGVGNSQYGTIWITNGIENKKIKKDEPILEGYRKGRTISFSP